MKIAVLGSSGPTGKHIVQQAMEKGHQVVAIIRNPQNFALSHPNLDVKQSDALIPSTLTNRLNGCDVVVSALGVGGSFKATAVYSEGTKNVIEEMRKAGIKKFICITSGGVEDTDPSFSFIYKLIFKPLLRKPYSDMKKLETYLQSVKDIQWIIVRPTQLTNSQLTGVYRVSERYAPKGGVKISRADVAHFILQQINSDEWVGKTPTLGY